MLAYLLNVFRVDYADLYPASLEPRGRYLDDRLGKLMNTSFEGVLWPCHFVPKHEQNSLKDCRLRRGC
jgi:hypothetical protein